MPAQQQVPVPVRKVANGGTVPLPRYPERVVPKQTIEELDIPTFIRRQMD